MTKQLIIRAASCDDYSQCHRVVTMGAPVEPPHQTDANQGCFVYSTCTEIISPDGSFGGLFTIEYAKPRAEACAQRVPWAN